MTTAPDSSPPRRTQRERREATIAKLVDATAQTIVEIGYSKTSVREICSRAGVSDGALFRHFDTRLDLIVACADHVADQTIQELGDLAEVTPGPDQTARVIAKAIRQATRRPYSSVWQELFVAARTDEELRRRMKPALQRYIDLSTQLMRSLPGVEDLPPEQIGLWQLLLSHVFTSEALVGVVVPDERSEELLLDFVTGLMDRSFISDVSP